MLAPAPSYCFALVNDNSTPIVVAIVIIQKNVDVNEDNAEVLSLKTSKFEAKNPAIISDPQCAIPVAPNAIANIIIRSERLGFRVTFSE